MGVYPELEHLLLDRRVPLHVDIVAIEIGELLGVEQIAIDGQVADLRVLEDPGREGRRLQAGTLWLSWKAFERRVILARLCPWLRVNWWSSSSSIHSCDSRDACCAGTVASMAASCAS